MVTRIDCFLLERTEFYERVLRRYSSQTYCPLPHGYHQAESILDVIKAPEVESESEGNSTVEFVDTFHPLWPRECDCGDYKFKDTDIWQWDQRRLYINPLTEEKFPLTKAPVGAMWYADWMSPWLGPDGHCLVVRTPAGEWIIDGPNNNMRPGWKRVGTPPRVTVTPAVNMNGFSGWLKEGVLIG